MTLETDTVQLHTGVQHGLGEIEEGCRLRTGVLVVVFIDVELGTGIGGRCSLERDVDVCRTESVVEYISTPSSVVIAEIMVSIESRDKKNIYFLTKAR